MKLFVTAFTILVIVVNGRDLGDILFGKNIPKCQRTGDESQTNCVVDYFERYIRPILIEGVPLEGYPGFLDPLIIENDHLHIVKPGLEVSGNASNIVFRGLGDSIIKQVRYDYENSDFHVKLTIPKLLLTCNYSVGGSKIIFLNLETSGKFQGTFVKVDVDITGRMETHYYNGMEFAITTGLRVNLAFGSGTKVHLEPNDTSVLAKLGVSIFNLAPTQAVLYMFRNDIKISVSRVLEDKIDDILSMLPLKLIFE